MWFYSEKKTPMSHLINVNDIVQRFVPQTSTMLIIIFEVKGAVTTVFITFPFRNKENITKLYSIICVYIFEKIS